MSDIGTIAWRDLTVPNATEISAFYGAVTGWQAAPQDMGGYADYNMHDANGEVVAGICHARGTNADLPPRWLVYVTVADVDASAAECTRRGGKLISGPRDMGQYRFCVIEDPAGAVAGLISTTAGA